MAIDILLKKEAESVEEAVLLEWHKKEGAAVTKGELIATAESYKAVIEIDAPGSGVISEILVAEGEVFEFPVVLGRIGSEVVSAKKGVSSGDEKTSAIKEKKAVKPAAPSSLKREATKGTGLSPAARRFAEKAGVSTELIIKEIDKDIIKKKDVEEFLSKRSKSQESKGPKASVDAGAGRLSAEFLKSLGDEDFVESFSKLSSKEKVASLKNGGAEIGDGVSIGRGTVIISERLVIGAGTVIGDGCRFEVKDFQVGQMACFEDNILWRCRAVHIGDMFYCSSEARVGWGGELGPEARLIIGDNSFIGEQVMLNPSRRITIEDEVAIGAGSKLYTHQFWQSVLDGYNASHAPITVRSNVQIGANVVVLPGVTIGSGATVTANSTVTFNVKDNHLMGGIPAVSLGKGMYPRKLSGEDRAKLIKKLLNEFIAEQGFESDIDVTTTEAVKWSGKSTDVAYLPKLDESSLKETAGKRTLLVTASGEDKGTTLPDGVTVFYMDSKATGGKEDERSDLLREFFRKRGIRFSPMHWRYTYKEGVVL